MSEKNKEQQLRRALYKMGYHLQKSLARNWSCDNQCGYRVTDAFNNAVVSGERYDLTLEDVEAFVNE